MKVEKELDTATRRKYFENAGSSPRHVFLPLVLNVLHRCTPLSSYALLSSNPLPLPLYKPPKMFCKLSALVALVPLVSALTLSTPENLTSGGPATITWTNESGDPSTFSLELVNTVFHDTFAIANNVVPASGSITINLPSVPARDGYTLEAVDISNINSVLATSGSFTIGAQSSSSVASSTSSSAASSASGSGSATSSGSVAATTTSAFGHTTTGAASSAASSSGSGTTSAASAAASNFNGASSSLNFGGPGAYAVGLLAAVAGTFFVAF
ncbi:hypothetical protein PLICRDRAFT_35273 [Plicaturopsis crispa FD-325 SS-3]|nr:hypothetical protein PLICRDRAFT_35273 [Plicaturopsis crispa FD-325 SS-3]